jgi:hypothetical protein
MHRASHMTQLHQRELSTNDPVDVCTGTYSLVSLVAALVAVALKKICRRWRAAVIRYNLFSIAPLTKAGQ